jgi:hypothetical protein
MNELLDEQVCPYCEHVVEDCHSNWDEDTEEVTCDRCNKDYMVNAVYKFKGFQIEKQCEECGDYTDEGMFLCDCEEDEI